MRDSTILVIGAGIFLGFLGFLAYLSYLASRQSEVPLTTQAQTYMPVYVPQATDVPKEVAVMETEETRPTKPHIINHVLNNSNTWYEIPIPPEIRTWSMNARGTYDILYSFEPSQSTYRTLFSGMFLDSDTMPTGVMPTSIYVSSAIAGAVVELSLFR